MSKRTVSRREFIGAASKAAAGVAAVAAAPGAALGAAGTALPYSPKDVLNYQPSMNYRLLGKTGLWLSEISLGGHWRTREGHRYWGGFPDDKVPADVQRNREDVVGRAIDLGINYVDITTPGEAVAYGNCQKALGRKIWIGYSDYILCIRDPANRTREKIMFEITEGLRRLQVDCIDIFRPQALMDGNHTDEEIDTVVETGLLAKQQGKIAHLGISAHSYDFHVRLIEGWPEFEMVVLPYTGASELTRHGVYALSHEKNVGTVGLKPFSGGSLFRGMEQRIGAAAASEMELARLTLKCILENPYLTASIPGMTTIDELENNLSILREKRSLTQAERAMVLAENRAAMKRLPEHYAWLRDWQYC